MWISELSERTGVPVHTIKYYLREGLVPSGEVTSRTRATYDESHVQRVRLVRALTEVGGLPIASVREVVAALDDPPHTWHEFLGAAHTALPSPYAAEPPSDDVREFVQRVGWQVEGSMLLGQLTSVLRGLEEAQLDRGLDTLVAYAQALRRVAELDVERVRPDVDPATALQGVVVGNLLTDPMIIILRRLAQEAISAELFSALADAGVDLDRVDLGPADHDSAASAASADLDRAP